MLDQDLPLKTISCPGVAGIMRFCLVTVVTAGQDLIKSIILSLLEKERVLKEDPDVEAAVDRHSQQIFACLLSGSVTESSQTNTDQTTDFFSFHSAKSRTV